MRATEDFYDALKCEHGALRAAGLRKCERAIQSPQASQVATADERQVIHRSANNDLGLSSQPDVIAAAHAALETRGFGLSFELNHASIIDGIRLCKATRAQLDAASIAFAQAGSALTVVA